MSKIDVSVSVEKSPYDLMAHLAKFIAAVKASGGFQASAIPADIGALVAELPGMVADCAALPQELAEDRWAFAEGCEEGAKLVAKAVFAK